MSLNGFSSGMENSVDPDHQATSEDPDLHNFQNRIYLGTKLVVEYTIINSKLNHMDLYGKCCKFRKPVA